MQDWVSSGRIVDAILVLMFLEAAVLMFWGRVKPLSVGATLAAGACLLVALRVALTGGSPISILAWLMAALPCHAIDIWLRRKK